MLPHPLTNFETRKYYQKKSKFNRVYSIDNLPDKTNGAYVISILYWNSLDCFVCTE